MTNHITTKWLGDMTFESNNPSGHNLTMDAGPKDGGSGNGLRPKALMLSALGGCTGLDVAALIKKMKLEVGNFKIETIAELSDEHPKFYKEVRIEYHFYGTNLNEKKLHRAVSLSIDKYCGVFEMFRGFASVTTDVLFHSE